MYYFPLYVNLPVNFKALSRVSQQCISLCHKDAQNDKV